MRKIVLRMNEENKYQVIKKLVDTNGNKMKAAIKLGCSIRTINRLIIKYKEEGKKGFIHGNRNRKPSTTIDLDIRNKIVEYYINEYQDANYRHFIQIIQEDFGICISDTTLRKWLLEENIISPKANRSTKKALKKKLKAKLDETKSVKLSNEVKKYINEIDERNAHPRRPRCKYEGEMIQMDASSFNWISNEIWHLHLAIDDASGKVVGAYFDSEETLNGYYNIFKQILENYGIPNMFYTDKRTVFEYQKKKTPLEDEDTFTQFSYACHNLGVKIKTTSIAQAKGRIERLNQTFQSRLPIDLRRACISNITEANEFLKSYIIKSNDMFALKLNNTQSVYEKSPSDEKINLLLAIISNRVIDSGHSIKYKNEYYIPIKSNGDRIYFKNKTKCLVIEAFDNNLYANIDDNIYSLLKIDKHEKYSEEFDSDIPKETKTKKVYIPPMTHPWKQASYNQYLAKQKHLHIGANV